MMMIIMVWILQELVGVYVDQNVLKSKAIVLELGAVVKRELVWFPNPLVAGCGLGERRSFFSQSGLKI